MGSVRYSFILAAVGAVSTLQGAGFAAYGQEEKFPSYSVIVLESDVPEIDARQVYTSMMPAGESGVEKPWVFDIPAGKTLKIMKPSGAIESYSGPQSVKVGDLMDSEFESATFTKFAQDIIDGNYNNSFLGRGLGSSPPADTSAAQPAQPAPLFDPNKIDWGDGK
jgi:hypothetical protein